MGDLGQDTVLRDGVWGCPESLCPQTQHLHRSGLKEKDIEGEGKEWSINHFSQKNMGRDVET